MVTEPLPKPWTVQDFLEWEAQQPERYEFIEGVIVMMVGGSAAHTTSRAICSLRLATACVGHPGAR
jgi:Uma2 family endonuclease